MSKADPFDALRALRATMPDAPDISAPAEEGAANTAGALRAKVFYERKGRGGKEATILEFDASADAECLADLARRLKTALAVGGSVRDNEILLQGDCRRRLPAILDSLNIKRLQ